mmetsp:Transcript_50529/g.152232  ORF Transcript_50529/g.152232 Transcript_50529/m.152232 type:complete len:240 (-) Transcript_50529:1912-2631(-)
MGRFGLGSSRFGLGSGRFGLLGPAGRRFDLGGHPREFLRLGFEVGSGRVGQAEDLLGGGLNLVPGGLELLFYILSVTPCRFELLPGLSFITPSILELLAGSFGIAPHLLEVTFELLADSFGVVPHLLEILPGPAGVFLRPFDLHPQCIPLLLCLARLPLRLVQFLPQLRFDDVGRIGYQRHLLPVSSELGTDVLEVDVAGVPDVECQLEVGILGTDLFVQCDDLVLGRSEVQIPGGDLG